MPKDVAILPIKLAYSAEPRQKAQAIAKLQNPVSPSVQILPISNFVVFTPPLTQPLQVQAAVIAQIRVALTVSKIPKTVEAMLLAPMVPMYPLLAPTLTSPKGQVEFVLLLLIPKKPEPVLRQVTSGTVTPAKTKLHQELLLMSPVHISNRDRKWETAQPQVSVMITVLLTRVPAKVLIQLHQDQPIITTHIFTTLPVPR